MRLLLDACVWSGAVDDLIEAGHEAVWSGELGEDPGDEALLERAAKENRVMVTLDKDFCELAVVRGIRHRGLVRLVDLSAVQQGPACVLALERYASELESGAIVTVEPGRVRVRPADSR
jgi:predicted nuclease of predicted toxin-antitoxin system